MEKEYRLSGYISILYGLTAIALAGFAIYLFTVRPPGPNPGPLIFIRLLSAAMLTGGVLMVVNIKRKRVVTDDESILYVSLFSKRQLYNTEVKGCRIGAKRIRLEPLAGGARGITIGNYNDLKDCNELSSWVRSRFVDLDAQDLAVHQREAASNPGLGATEAERLKYLQRSKDIALAYNICGFIGGFVLLFLKGSIGSILLITIPMLGIVLMGSTRGTIKFVSSSAVSPYPFVMLGMVICSIAIVGKSSIEFTLLEIGPLLAPGVAVAAIVFVLLFVFGRNSTLRSLWSQIIIMGITSLLYGLGSVKLVNCSLDAHEPVVYSATVLHHHIRHGKSVSYFLKLGPWGPRVDDEDVQVGHGFYSSVSNGDSVAVYVKPGLMHIRWFYLTAHFPPQPAAAQP